MKILVIGSGGREHAICEKLIQSDKKPILYAAPGNAGISRIATCVDIPVDDIEGLLDFAKRNTIDLTIVGPELPLVMGIVDVFEAEGLAIFGPNKMASQFEGSKDFTKAFLMRHGIPTAHYETHTDLSEALEALARFSYPVVIKADGLAAGKGVVIAESRDVAEETLRSMMEGLAFGKAGLKVVLEAFLTGVEASILCFVDGKTILPMSPAQDYKKALNGDKGLNTGGMGTYSPSRIIDAELMDRIQRELLDPFIVGIQKDGMDFRGILFVGLMIEGSEINVLEYNVRLGDPETEVTLVRMENDLIDVIQAVLDGNLSEVELMWSVKHAVCVIMASGGYPETYEKGKYIYGLGDEADPLVFHCGTQWKNNAIVTSGGRVLGVTALGNTLEEARKEAYSKVAQIKFDGMIYRSDIAKFG